MSKTKVCDFFCRVKAWQAAEIFEVVESFVDVLTLARVLAAPSKEEHFFHYIFTFALLFAFWLQCEIPGLRQTSQGSRSRSLWDFASSSWPLPRSTCRCPASKGVRANTQGARDIDFAFYAEW